MKMVLVLALLVCGAEQLAGQDAEAVAVSYGRITLRRDEGRTEGTVPAGRDAVYRVVATALKDLGIKAQVDSSRYEVTATRQKATGKLGSKRVSTYLSCGMGLLGSNADSWHVYYSFSASVTAGTASSSGLVLTFTADAVDVPNGRNETLPCRSTGKLELEIARRLDAAFPAPTPP